MNLYRSVLVIVGGILLAEGNLAEDNRVCDNEGNLITKPDGAFKTPSSSNKITQLQNKIQELQITASLVTLEEVLEILNRKLMDKLESMEKSIRKHGNQLTAITDELNKLLKDLESRENENKFRNLTDQCVRAVNNNDPKKAAEILDKSFEENMIYKIFNNVYEHKLKNFDLIMKFGREINEISKSFIVYKSLFMEMQKYNINDGMKILELMRTIHFDIIKGNVTQHLKDEATEINNLLRSKLVSAMKVEFRKQLSHPNKTNELNERVYNFNEDIYNDAYHEFLTEAYKERYVSTEELMKFNYRNNNLSISLHGFRVIHDLMKSNHADINGTNIVKLAIYYKSFSKIDSKDISFYEDCKNALPDSVKNAMFSEKVCLKSVGKNEYLYASTFHRNEEVNRRIVYIWVPRNTDNMCKWYMEHAYDDVFYLRNYEHNEYLYAPEMRNDDFDFTKDNRLMFTYSPEVRDTQGEWRLEPNGDNCYFKNIAKNEYLYASSYLKDKKRRYAFTWIPSSTQVQNDDWLWRIESC